MCLLLQQPSSAGCGIDTGASACVRFTIGTRVVLAVDYTRYSDASEGPLRPGDVGVLKSDGGTRFRVKCSNGRKWWYDIAALRRAEGDIDTGTTSATAMRSELITGARVVRGPNWKWGDQDGGTGNVGVVTAGTDSRTDKWVSVKWNSNSRTNLYRYGADGAFDVMQVTP